MQKKNIAQHALSCSAILFHACFVTPIHCEHLHLQTLEDSLNIIIFIIMILVQLVLQVANAHDQKSVDASLLANSL